MSFPKLTSFWGLAVCLALSVATFSLVAAPVKVGHIFPDLSKFKLEGQLPGPLQGKVVLVDFWASWCAPCKKSFPALDELHQRYRNKGLIIIAVSVDEKRAAMEAFLKKTPTGFTIVRDPAQKLVAAVSVETMPTSFLLDATGRVRFVHAGYRGDETKKDYIREIEELLKSQ